MYPNFILLLLYTLLLHGNEGRSRQRQTEEHSECSANENFVIGSKYTQKLRVIFDLGFCSEDGEPIKKL